MPEEDIDYKELFHRAQVENEVLHAHLQFAPPVTFSWPDISWLFRLYSRDPMRFLYVAFAIGYIAVVSLQCVALVKEIRS
jgi:hypothetical protein